jgi:cyanophycinase-like exopeptidase
VSGADSAGDIRPGPVVLFGSGETGPTGRLACERVLARYARPVRVVVLETPAGFQPNSALVAGRVADFFRQRLPNFAPDVTVIPARRRDSELGTNNPALLAPIRRADALFLGPGSPTYTVKHLAATLAYRALAARHRQGAALILASAAAIAFGTYALPVYEIYKVGDDPHWQSGLDFFGLYGLRLVVVPHWNNREGGEELDTSRCFMGQERWARLEALLPPGPTVLGIEEQTAALLDFERATVEVVGRGAVIIRRDREETTFGPGETFALDRLGRWEIPPASWLPMPEGIPEPPEPELPAEVVRLVWEREAARRAADWARADALRAELNRLGYEIQDTREGPRWRPTGQRQAPFRPVPAPETLPGS